MSPKARESVITSVVLLIIYGFLFAQTMGMPSTPALFPRVCLILLTVLTVIMLYLDVRKYAKDHDAESGVPLEGNCRAACGLCGDRGVCGFV